MDYAKNFFEFGNPGYDALKSDFKLSYKIANYIFVHGQLTTNLTWDDHNTITEILTNIPDSTDLNLQNVLNSKSQSLQIINMKINEGSGPLWERVWGVAVGKPGGTTGPNNRIGTMTGFVKPNMIAIGSDDYCTNISDIIKKFCSTLPNTDPNCTDKNPDSSAGVSVIVGHCIQSDATIKNQPSMTFADKNNGEYLSSDRTQTFLGETIYYGPPLLVHHRDGSHAKPIIFGITTDCIGKNQNRIYRVDVGASRGFDNSNNVELLNNANPADKTKLLNKIYFSRTPQALKINLIANTQSISRSKLSNTIHNVPRPDLNAVIATLNTQGPQGIVNILDTYDKKYRKYKSKYLKKDT